jgi:biotin carboxylase
MKDKKAILILGAGTMQIPAIESAKKKGWTVIVADGNPCAEGRTLADRFEQIDLKDFEAMATMATELKQNTGLDGVFTAGTDFSSTVAFVAERLGLPGIGFEAALNATDKARMRQKFHKHGVPSPAFVVLDRAADPLSVLTDIPFPLVVKPVDNMGSRGVRRIDTSDDLLEAFEKAIEYSRSGRVIVEEFIDGEEYSLDALVWNGNFRLCGIAIRHIFFPPYFVEMGHTMPSALDEQTHTAIIDAFRRGIRALGITNGAAKGDIKLSKRGPMIGEIAARLSGGYMSGWTYPFSSGVDLTGAALNIAAGLAPGNLDPTFDRVSAERAFISLPGKINDIRGFEEASMMPKIKAAFIRVRAGDDVVFPTNNVEKCGNLIAVDDSRDGAICTAENAVGRIMLRLEPDNPKTDEFLVVNINRGKKGRIRFFELGDASNRAAVDRMEWFTMMDESGWTNKRTEIVYLALPAFDHEHARNPIGQHFNRAFAQVVETTGIAEYDPEFHARLVLGRIFWEAFLTGGAQAAVYVVDTIRTIQTDENKLERWLHKWQE